MNKLVRWILFILSIIVGAVLMVTVFDREDAQDESLASLKDLSIDYRTDYVLMVAEIYTQEQDLDQAARRLALISDAPPVIQMMEAIRFAEDIGYNERDLQLLQQLNNAFIATQGEATP